MKSLFENADLYINSWGFMNGYLKDRQIQAN